MRYSYDRIVLDRIINVRPDADGAVMMEMMHGPLGPWNDTRECDGKGGSEVVTPNT